MRTRFLPLLALISGAVAPPLAIAETSSPPAHTQATTQICIFNVGEKKLGIDDELKTSSAGLASLPVTGFTGGGNFTIQDYFHSKQDSDALHSFQTFIQNQIQSGSRCDGLVISGAYSAGVYTGKGQLRVADVLSLLKQPEVQAWANKVKSVYMDGSQTMSAVMMLNQSFPNAIVFGNDSDVLMNKFSRARKSKSKQFLESAARLNQPVTAVIKVEQVQESLDAVMTNPALADPSVSTYNFYQDYVHPLTLEELIKETSPPPPADVHAGATQH